MLSDTVVKNITDTPLGPALSHTLPKSNHLRVSYMDIVTYAAS